VSGWTCDPVSADGTHGVQPAEWSQSCLRLSPGDRGIGKISCSMQMCDCAHKTLQISGANPDGAAAKAGWYNMVVAAPARRLHLRLTGTTTKLMPTVSFERHCSLTGGL
jgi:hypothetical protein